LNIPASIMAPDRSTCVTVSGGSIIDYFVVHKKLSGTCQEVQIVKEGYSAPHRPVGMLIKGQQAQGKIEVHKRLPALKAVAIHGPFPSTPIL